MSRSPDRRSSLERGSPETKPRSCGNQPAHESLFNRRLRVLYPAVRISDPTSSATAEQIVASEPLKANMRAGCGKNQYEQKQYTAMNFPACSVTNCLTTIPEPLAADPRAASRPCVDVMRHGRVLRTLAEPTWRPVGSWISGLGTPHFFHHRLRPLVG